MIQQPDSSGKRCKNDYPQLLSNTIKFLTTSGCTSWGAFYNMDEQEKQRGKRRSGSHNRKLWKHKQEFSLHEYNRNKPQQARACRARKADQRRWAATSQYFGDS